MRIFQVISENFSSNVPFRPELQHLAEPMQHPADSRQHPQINLKAHQINLTQNKTQAKLIPIDSNYLSQRQALQRQLQSKIQSPADLREGNLDQICLQEASGVKESQNCLRELQKLDQKSETCTNSDRNQYLFIGWFRHWRITYEIRKAHIYVWSQFHTRDKIDLH